MSDLPADIFTFETAGVPRDLVGYGLNPPNPRWPHGAKIAVSFVLNFEEGAENCIVNGPPEEGCKYDTHTEFLLNDMNPTAQPAFNVRNLNMESIYEYGTRSAFQRITSIFQKAGKYSGPNQYNNTTQRPLPLTVYACGKALEQTPDLGHLMVTSGFEVSTHHYRWIDYSATPYAVEAAHTQKTIDAQEKIVGYPPIGFYVGRPSMNSRGIAMRAAQNDPAVVENGLFKGFLYDNDAYNDDLPYWYRADKYAAEELEKAGKSVTAESLPPCARPMLVLPYTLELNDRKFVSQGAGYSACDDFVESAKAAILQILDEVGDEESTQTGFAVPKMISIGLHCRLSGRPSRAYAIKKILDWIMEFNAAYPRPEGIPADHANHYTPIWVARRVEIARHWYKNFYPTDSLVPNPLETLDVIPQDFDKYADDVVAKKATQ